MCAFSAYFLLPVYLTDLGATESLVGAIMSSMGVSNAITLIWIYFWGKIADQDHSAFIFADRSYHRDNRADEE